MATVSRALNDAPDIKSDTKRRVREIARQIGYVPDRAGVRLRTGKTNVISLVLGTDSDVTDHTGQLVSSIARVLRDTPYHMIVTPYAPQEDPMQPVRYIAETGSADAIILNRIQHDDPRCDYLRERGVPFVTYGRTQNCATEAYFDFDNGYFGKIAAEELVKAERKNIAIIAPPMDQNYARHMTEAARKQLAKNGLQLIVMPGATSDDQSAKMREAVTKLLIDEPDLDGLICPSTTSSIAATVAIEASGRELGSDIDLFAKEAIPFLRHFRNEIMTVTENVAEAGAFLAQAAIAQIKDPSAPLMQKLVAAQMPDDTSY